MNFETSSADCDEQKTTFNSNCENPDCFSKSPLLISLPYIECKTWNDKHIRALLCRECISYVPIQPVIVDTILVLKSDCRTVAFQKITDAINDNFRITQGLTTESCFNCSVEYTKSINISYSLSSESSHSPDEIKTLSVNACIPCEYHLLQSLQKDGLRYKPNETVTCLKRALAYAESSCLLEQVRNSLLRGEQDCEACEALIDNESTFENCACNDCVRTRENWYKFKV